MLANSERLREKMEAEDIDGIVAATLPNVLYLAGFESLALSGFPYDGQCYAVITRDTIKDPIVITSTVEMDQLLDGNARHSVRFGTFYREDAVGSVQLTEEEMWLYDHSVTMSEKQSPLDGLVSALSDLGLNDKRIGVDELGLLDGYFDHLAERVPKADFRKVSAMLRWVRKVKTEEEIGRLRGSAMMTEQAIRSAAAIARVGVTEYELAREFERSIVSQGGRPQFTLIRFGRNAVAGQRLPGKTQLENGDTIWFDVGATFKGYWSDIARIFCLGEPSKRVKTIYGALLQGEKVGIAQTKPGMTGADLFNITMEATRNAGHPDYRRHHVGHGIGAEVYEPPILRPDNQDLIEVGSVINIETPYYEFGLGALHVEDPYVVKADGEHELLTTLGRELHVIPIES